MTEKRVKTEKTQIQTFLLETLPFTLSKPYFYPCTFDFVDGEYIFRKSTEKATSVYKIFISDP